MNFNLIFFFIQKKKIMWSLRGCYVVSKEKPEWVYDVTVTEETGGEIICTVGFTKNQKEGGLFWGNTTMNNKYWRDTDKLKEFAKEYAISQHVI